MTAKHTVLFVDDEPEVRRALARVIRREPYTAVFAGNGLEESLRLLDQETTTVTGLAVGGNRAAVGHAAQRLDGGLHQPVAGRAIHMGHQAKSTVILLERGMI